jgi:hypothetical protein
MPADIYGSSDDKRLFVGLTGSDSVEVFDVSGAQPSSIKRIKTGSGAHAFRAAGDKRHLYVSNCRIPDDCIDSKRYPLFIARAVLKELIESLQSIQGVKPC